MNPFKSIEDYLMTKWNESWVFEMYANGIVAIVLGNCIGLTIAKYLIAVIDKHFPC